MDSFITRIKTNLNGVLQMTQMIDGIMMTGDDKANKIIVELHRDRDPYIIPAGTKIVGYFIRSDGMTLELDGAVDENGHAIVTIPALAYQIPGVLSIAIRMFVDPSQQQQRGYYSSTSEEFVIVDDPEVTEGPNEEPVITRTVTVYANKVVIAAASCFVQMTETDSVIEPGHVIPDINDVIAKLAEMDDTIQQVTTHDAAYTEAENARVSAETSRVQAETSRVTAETSRVQAETARDAAETLRDSAEAIRIANENARIQAETARSTAEGTRETNETARQYAIQNMTVDAVALPYDATPTATITTVSGAKHIQFGLVSGKPFRIKKTFASIAEMQAYTGTDVELYELVVITSNVEDPDNSKMYMKVPAPDNWFYVTDLSGAQGIQGPQGIQGIQGVSVTGAVQNANYTMTINFSDGTSYTTPMSVRGVQGEQGIQGETGNGIAGTTLNPDYTLTIEFTDGSSYTTPISIRGAQGEQGIQGNRGPGISSAVVNADYTMTLNFENGTTYTTPFSMRGPKGDPGSGGTLITYDSLENAVTVEFG